MILSDMILNSDMHMCDIVFLSTLALHTPAQISHTTGA